MPVESTAQKASPSRPDIFGYHDYRLFLKDWFEYLKATKPGFSLRALSRQADLANGYLPMILSGSRNLSMKAWAKMSPHLGLTPSERSYLQSLHALSVASSHTLRMEVFDKIQRFSAYQKKNPKEIETYRYLTRWFYVAIREMAALPDFKMDPQWIQGRLQAHVPLNEIKQATEFLLKNGYLEKLPDNKAHLPKKNVSCVGGVFKIALGKFHREMLSLATAAIDTTPSDQRTITGHTLAIPESKYTEVKKILDEALSKISELGSPKDASDSVYHVTLTAFPITRKVKRREPRDFD